MKIDYKDKPNSQSIPFKIIKYPLISINNDYSNDNKLLILFLNAVFSIIPVKEDAPGP